MWKILLAGLILSTLGMNAQAVEPTPDDSTSTSQTIPKEIEKASKEIFGINPRDKFSLYQPTYFAFGKDNLKIQFSGKYRLANSYNLYLAYTQTMFWNIYDTSAPFDDINYNPEVFYRLAESDSSFLRSIDFGMIHTSNGEEGAKSRSINRYFVKANTVTQIKRHTLMSEFKVYNIYSKSSNNDKIIDHMGYWDLKLVLTHIFVHDKQRLDIEYRFFAGKKVYNIQKGGRELGLVYRFGSDNFNPAIYLQYYSGYAESLLHYDQKVSQARLGLLLFF